MGTPALLTDRKLLVGVCIGLIAAMLLAVLAMLPWGGTAQAAATSTSFDPTTVGLGGVGSTTVVTVKAVNVDGNVNGVQLNLQYDKTIFKVTLPPAPAPAPCTGMFTGGSSTGPTDVTGGTLIGCFLIGATVGTGTPPAAATGDVMRFTIELLQTFTGNKTMTFGTGVGNGTEFSASGGSVGAGTLNTLTITPCCTVSGKTTLQFRTTGDPPSMAADAAAQVKVCIEGAAPFITRCTPLHAPDGSWKFDGVPGGTYSVTASAFSYLSTKKEGLVVTNVDVTLPTAQLRGGDINGDGFVNINDITGAVSNFGKSSPQVWPAS